MEIKLFGRSLFKATRNELNWGIAQSEVKASKYLPDFFKKDDVYEFSEAMIAIPSGPMTTTAYETGKEKPKKPEEEPKSKLTPKEVYNLEMLHDKAFKLNTDTKYVDKQLADFKDKLGLIKSEEFDMRRGVDEIASIIVRLENRKKYVDNRKFFENYPYTQTSKITELIKNHDYLKIGQVAQFIADMPAEAVSAMKEYNKATDKVCGKQAVFYIIADKKDFKKSDTRRDPILLAQSPFGHFWQILGAWDKEMMFVEEL